MSGAGILNNAGAGVDRPTVDVLAVMDYEADRTARLEGYDGERATAARAARAAVAELIAAAQESRRFFITPTRLPSRHDRARLESNARMVAALAAVGAA